MKDCFSNYISGNLLRLLRDFQCCRKQRVVLNGQNSWKNVNAGVFQSPILGPLLFLIYINVYQMVRLEVRNFLLMRRLFFQN